MARTMARLRRPPLVVVSCDKANWRLDLTRVSRSFTYWEPTRTHVIQRLLILQDTHRPEIVFGYGTAGMNRESVAAGGALQ